MADDRDRPEPTTPFEPVSSTPAEPSSDSRLDAGLRAAFAPNSELGSSADGVIASNSISELMPQSARIMLRENLSDTDDPLTLRHGDHASPAGGRYQVLGEIARGGMGTILRGRDHELGRDLAIKVLQTGHSSNPRMLQRFIEEAQISGQLQHPGIVPVYDVGQFNDRRPFFAMKLVRGRTLAALLSEREAPDQNRAHFLSIFGQVCQTIAYAHARGVIHRDLKPSNIMVGSFGEIQVMDWGLAKVLGAGGVDDEVKAEERSKDRTVIRTLRNHKETMRRAATDTMAGSVLGTPSYMAPEQARGENDKLDERCDVFGLGAILCEILTGTPPYRIDREHSLENLPQAIERLKRSPADRALIQLACRCIAAAPVDRPANAGVLAKEFSEYMESVEDRLRNAEFKQRAEVLRSQEERRRWRIIATSLAIALIAVIVGGGSWMKMLRTQSELRREEAREQSALAVKLQQSMQESNRLGTEAFAGESIDPRLWRQAELAHRRAISYLEQVPPTLDASDLIGNTQDHFAAFQDDLKLMNDLEDAQFAAAWVNTERNRFEVRVKYDRIRDALANYGISQGDDPVEVESRMAARPTTVQEALIVAIEEWLAGSRNVTPLSLDYVGDQVIITGVDPYCLNTSERPLEPGDQLLGFWENDKLLDASTLGRLAIEKRFFESTQPSITIQVARQADESDQRTLMTHTIRPQATRLWLRSLLDSLDRDPWRRRFRTAAEVRDSARVRQLAASDEAFDQPRSMLRLIGDTLAHHASSNASIDFLKKAQQKYPDDLWLNVELAIRLSHMQRPQQALPYCAAALAIRPGNVGLQNNYALLLQQVGETDAAEQWLRRCLELRPEYWHARVNLANLLATDRTRLDEAIDEYQRSLAFAGDSDRSRQIETSLADALERKGNAKQAIEILQRVAMDEPTHAEAHGKLGWIYAKAGDLLTAEENLREALRANPKDAVTQYHLAIVKLLGGDLEEGVVEYEKAIALKLIDSSMITIAELFFDLGDDDHTIESLEYILRKTPYDYQANRLIAATWDRKGDMTRAAEAYRAAARSQPNNGPLLRETARTLEASGRLNLADQYYDRLVRIYESRGEIPVGRFSIWLDYGRLAQKLGDVPRAEQLTRRAIEIAPDAWQTYAQLSDILLELDRSSEAAELLSRAIDLAPNAELYFNRARLSLQERRDDDAEGDLRKALQLAPNHEEAAAELALLLSRQPRREEAQAWVSETIEQFPDSVELQLMRQLLTLTESDLDEETRELYRCMIRNLPIARQASLLQLLELRTNNANDTRSD